MFECNDGKCTPKAGEGNLDLFCNADSQCKSSRCVGFVCIPDIDRDLGASCDSLNTICKLTLECVDSKCVPKPGLGELDDYCTANSQCKSGNCGANKCVPPTTVTDLDLGATCDATHLCKADLDCSNGKCVPKPGQGQPNEYCNGDSQCDSGFCIPLVNTCGPRIEPGLICSTAPLCKVGYICIQNNCVPDNGNGENGEYCNANSQCKSGACIANKCANPPVVTDLDLGATCGANLICKTTLECKDSKCVPKDGQGETGNYCNANSQCKSSQCVANACKAPPATGLDLGSTCNADNICKDSLDCKMGKCVPKPGQGESTNFCNDDAQCKSTKCVSNACTTPPMTGLDLGATCDANNLCKATLDCYGGKCVPKPGQGETNNYCSANGQCKSNICKSNKCAAAPVKDLPLGSSCNYSNKLCKTSLDCCQGKCVPKRGKGELNNYCNDNGQCKSSLCKNNVCVAKPLRGLGATCNKHDKCKSSLDCKWGRCVPKKGQGALDQYCNNSEQCKLGVCSSRNVCKQLDLGGRCWAGSQCRSGSCHWGRCVPKKTQGKPHEFCNAASQCMSNRCDGYRCAKPKLKCKLGDWCLWDGQCGSGKCSSCHCVPQKGAGHVGDYCNKASQCASWKCGKHNKCIK